MQGESAAKSLNDSLNDAPASLKGSAQVNQALLGTEPHDLSKLIAGLDKVDDRARHQRGAAEGPHHELQPLLRDLRRASRQNLSRVDPAARARRSRHARTSLDEPERGAAASSRASRATSSPACEETPATIAAVDAVDRAGAAALLAAPSSAGCSTPAARRPTASRRVVDDVVRPLQADRTSPAAASTR